MGNLRNILSEEGLLSDRLKTAGGTGWPLTPKDIKVGLRRIKKVCYDSGAFREAFLDGMDWGRVEFDKPEKNPYRSSGTLVWWRVYPMGKVGDKKSDYIYGYVMTEWVSGPKGIEISGTVTVKH
ncbi:MAG: hypothetical protein CMJ67_10310 [Planctomycetaceae bacterium]|nr:hypothetical protein [Planctomycetaceae bacterium]